MKRPGGFDEPAPERSEASHEAPRSAPQRAGIQLPRRRPSPDREPVSEPSPAPAPVTPLPMPTAATPIAPASAVEAATSQSREGDGVAEARDELKRASRERRRRERREQMRFTAHRRVRRRRWLVAGGTVLGLAIFVAAGVFTPVMAVRDIQVHGTQAMNPAELQTALSRFDGVPIALVRDQDVHRALESFPLVQRYVVERIPPHTLVVRIEERAPVIALERDGEFDLLDPSGVLLGRVAELPVGVPIGSPELTDTASPAFQAAATVVRDMPEDLRAALAAVRASNNQDVTLTLTAGTEVVWGEAKHTQRKAVVLRSLIASIGTPEMIDVSAPEAPVFK